MPPEASAAPPFVGREGLLRSLRRGLHGGERWALLGGARSGRTAALQQLVRRAAAARRAGAADELVPVYVDLARLAPAELPRALWQALQDAVRDPYVQNGQAPPRLQPITPALRGAGGWEELARLCGALFSALQNTPGWCRYAWLLDHADALLAPDFRAAAVALFAPFAPSPGAGAPWALLLAGGPALYDACASPLPAGWPVLRTLCLTPLLPVDAVALARARGLAPAAANEAMAAAGGHPALLQALLADPAAPPPGPPGAEAAALVAAMCPRQPSPSQAQARELIELLCREPSRRWAASALAPALGATTVHAGIDVALMSCLAQQALTGGGRTLFAPGTLVQEALAGALGR